jgi:hypothetical protein
VQLLHVAALCFRLARDVLGDLLFDMHRK